MEFIADAVFIDDIEGIQKMGFNVEEVITKLNDI